MYTGSYFENIGRFKDFFFVRSVYICQSKNKLAIYRIVLCSNPYSSPDSFKLSFCCVFQFQIYFHELVNNECLVSKLPNQKTASNFVVCNWSYC